MSNTENSTPKTKLTNTQVLNQRNSSVNPLNMLDEQEIRQIVGLNCIVVTGFTEDWEFDGKSGKSGSIQVLRKAREGSQRLELLSIKVGEDEFDSIDLIVGQYQFQYITLQCEVREDYGKMKTILTKEQPFLKVK